MFLISESVSNNSDSVNNKNDALQPVVEPKVFFTRKGRVVKPPLKLNL